MSAQKRSVQVEGIAHKAPIPLAARVGPLLCSSGIGGKDAAGNLPDDPAEQTRLAFENLETVLAAAGATLADVAKLTIYVRDDAVRAPINEQWQRCFPDAADRPARHILVYALQHGMAIQLEFIAYVQD